LPSKHIINKSQLDITAYLALDGISPKESILSQMQTTFQLDSGAYNNHLIRPSFNIMREVA